MVKKILFHGTIAPFGHSIQQEGFKTPKQSCVPGKWDLEGCPKDKIFVTNSFGHALTYGNLAGRSTGFTKAKINIFQVEVDTKDLEPEYDKKNHPFVPVSNAEKSLKEWSAAQTKVPPKVKKMCEIDPKKLEGYKNMDFETYKGHYFDRSKDIYTAMGYSEEQKAKLNKKLNDSLCKWKIVN